MENKLYGKLNSTGFIKSLEVYHNNRANVTSEIKLYMSEADANIVGDVKSMNNWLCSLSGANEFELPEMEYHMETGLGDKTSVISLEMQSFNEKEIDLINGLIGTLLKFMTPDKKVPTMSKVGVHINSAEIHTNLLSATLTLDMTTDVYMKYISAKEGEPEILLYSQESLEKVLTNLLSNSNIEIPPFTTIDDNVGENNISIIYNFKPGLYDDTLLEIFNYLTVNDFDDEGENAEDLFMDVNDKESDDNDFEIEQPSGEYNGNFDELKFITDIIKSLKMDMEMEVEEMTFEQESEFGERSKTKLSFKGLKFRGNMNS